MKIVAYQKSVRTAPRKVALVVAALKGLSLEETILQLGYLERRASLPVLKTLRQALANAEHNHGLTINELELESIEVSPGAQYRRFQAVSRGRAHGIIKKTTHIRVTLRDRVSAPATSSSASASKPSAGSTQVAGSTKPASATKSISSKKTTQPAQSKRGGASAPLTGVATSVSVAPAHTPQHTAPTASRPLPSVKQSHQRKGSR